MNSFIYNLFFFGWFFSSDLSSSLRCQSICPDFSGVFWNTPLVCDNKSPNPQSFSFQSSEYLVMCGRHTFSAPAPMTMILKINRTLSHTFPITVEWDWTLSRREDRNPHSPIVSEISKNWKQNYTMTNFISVFNSQNEAGEKTTQLPPKNYI